MHHVIRYSRRHRQRRGLKDLLPAPGLGRAGGPSLSRPAGLRDHATSIPHEILHQWNEGGDEIHDEIRLLIHPQILRIHHRQCLAVCLHHVYPSIRSHFGSSGCYACSSRVVAVLACRLTLLSTVMQATPGVLERFGVEQQDMPR